MTATKRKVREYCIVNPGVSRPCLYGRCGQCVAPDTCGCECGHPAPVVALKPDADQQAAEWVASLFRRVPGETAAAVRAARTERT